jgi:hypothetical protein
MTCGQLDREMSIGTVVKTSGLLGISWTVCGVLRRFVSEHIFIYFIFFNRCTVHFEDSSITIHQQMHQYYLLFKIGFN